MNDGLVEMTNQAVLAVLVGFGTFAVLGLLGLGVWLSRQRPDAPPEAKRPAPPASVVFTRRARSGTPSSGESRPSDQATGSDSRNVEP